MGTVASTTTDRLALTTLYSAMAMLLFLIVPIDIWVGVRNHSVTRKVIARTLANCKDIHHVHYQTPNKLIIHYQTHIADAIWYVWQNQFVTRLYLENLQHVLLTDN